MTPPPRLSLASLDALPADVGRPACDPRRLGRGIAHLGVGAFHRAHMAAVLDATLAEDPRWGVTGASLRSAATAAALAPQDGLYTLVETGPDGPRRRVIGALGRVIVAPRDPAALRAALIDPQTRIVSLTITEKGYRRDPASGALDLDAPDVRADLAAETPSTAPGWIVDALARRRAAGAAPFAVLSCDNLPDNGAATRRVLLDFARARDADLAAWLEDALVCPATMVDRIVPATTDADRAANDAALGLTDAWPVMAEPFLQFVVEDRFPGPRPPWEAAGVAMVADVAPYERMKLRMLNGAHSTLACLAQLAGHETVAEAVAAPGFAALLSAMMREEVAPTLSMPPGADLDAYRRALLARFANPGLRHRTEQIAMDGSQKLPQRLLDTVRDRLAAGAPFARLALGVAAWMRFAGGRADDGRPLAVSDPMAARLTAIAQDGRDAADVVGDFLSLRAVFGDDLPAAAPFREAVARAWTALAQDGAAATVEAWGEGEPA